MMNSENIEPQKLTVEGMEEMVASTDSVPYAFYQSNKNLPHCLFCFVEGKDDTDYYQPRVKNVYGDNYLFIKCNCRDYVLSVYNQIYESDHDSRKLAFFIDKDFNETTTLDGVFETDGYSIENYYVVESSFSEFLCYGLHIPKNSIEYNRAIDYYRTEFAKFHQAVLLLNVWAKVCRKRHLHGCMNNLKALKKKWPDDFITINFGSNYSKQYDLDKLNEHYQADPVVTQEELDREESSFKGCDLYMDLRGKFELHFLYDLLVDLKTKSNRKRKGEVVIIENFNWDLNYPCFMIYYSNFAKTPERLRAYISSYT